MSKKICFVFPSRERSLKFFKSLNDIQDMTENKNYSVLAILDNDDPYKEEYSALPKNYPEVTVVWGESKGKIDACNRGLSFLPADTDIVCLHSDDMVPVVFGFDEIIREHCGTDDYVHFPDGHANEALCTYSIMGIDYFKRFGYIYHPAYNSVYADNEQNDVAKILGRYKFINQMIIEHRHPAWGFGQADDLLLRTENPINYQKDHETYLRRKAINFDL